MRITSILWAGVVQNTAYLIHDSGSVTSNTVRTGIDTDPPDIIHSPIERVNMLCNQILVQATITDQTRVASATLYYRLMQEGTFTQVAMGTNSSLYSAVIPPDRVKPPAIVYKIWATDGSNGTFTDIYEIEVGTETSSVIGTGGGTVIVDDGNPDDGATQITILSGELEGTVTIRQRPVDKAPSGAGNIRIAEAQPVAYYEFFAEKTEFSQTITITLLYLDIDNDGYEDTTGVDERTLEVFWWDGSSWVLMECVRRDTDMNTITIETYHLSYYAIFSTQPPCPERLGKVLVYPNPLRMDKGQSQIMFGGGDRSTRLTEYATIRIFNIAGELVDQIDVYPEDEGIGKWEPNVASGVYIYLITNQKGDRITGKVGIIR